MSEMDDISPPLGPARDYDAVAKLHKAVAKAETERIDLQAQVGGLGQEVAYLRHVVEFQNQKIDKLTQFLAEYLQHKDPTALASLLQLLLELDQADQVRQVQAQAEVQVNSPLQNMDPALLVAQAAVLAQDKKPKKPKVPVDFLHNPMTVREIYEEYTKGFRGQPPLRDFDARYGKHEWRGDSRLKESKRFQRRKKLCDSIERGMRKYGKTAEEITQYIEEFRGEKSLTWVMNGNLPQDLL